MAAEAFRSATYFQADSTNRPLFRDRLRQLLCSARMRPSLLTQVVGIARRFTISKSLLRTKPFTMSSDVITAPMTSGPDVASYPKEEKADVAAATVPEPDAAPNNNEENTAGTKRSNQGQSEVTDGESQTKKARTEGGEGDEAWSGYARPFYKKKKVAMLVVYSGKGYTGMQMNPGMKTIEQDILDALLKAGVVTEDHVTKPGTKMGFQRAARTDKGVSAAGQVVSLKINVENAVEKINSHLADQIRVIGFKRVTRGFSSKDTCSSRTYIYMLPTFAFTPIEEFVTDNFKMSETLQEKINNVLGLYKGTHNFHNFTSGKKPTDPSAHRYIMEMGIGEPFMKDKVEFAVITVRGQSFMLHQIRKMIGLAIAIVRGLAGAKCIEKAWKPERVDVPMAPGLGLMLDQLHYDAYNKRFGTDGMHDAIEWGEYKDVIEKFKHDHIFSTIIETEKTERSMMRWLSTLHNHHFGERTSEHTSVRAETKIGQAANNIRKMELGIPLDTKDGDPYPPGYTPPATAPDTTDTPSTDKARVETATVETATVETATGDKSEDATATVDEVTDAATLDTKTENTATADKATADTATADPATKETDETSSTCKT